MMREGTELAVGFVLLAGVLGYGGYAVGTYQGRSAGVLYPAERGLPGVGEVAPAGQTGQAAPATFTIATVSQHNTPADCWIVISDKIYSVSSYLSLHPGGAARITPYCGQDATQAFATKGGEGIHSSLAQQELARLYVGSLGQPVTASGSVSQPPALPKPTAAQGSTPPPPTPPATTPTSATVSLALTDVAKHTTPSDCWIIISSKVYDVTNYLNQHPGGAFRITPYCGQDATQAFATQGGQGQHSSQAQQDLTAFYLGPVGGTTTVNPSSPPPAPSTTGSGSGEDEDEWEDD